MSTKTERETAPLEKMVELMTQFPYVMLVTHVDDCKMRARPMAVLKVEDSGDMWFITRDDTHKVTETHDTKDVTICGQAENLYVSLSGKISHIKDQKLIQDWWKEVWRIWIPDGPTDPRLMLLKVKPNFGEYWDYSGLGRRIEFIFEAAKSVFNKERPEIKGAHEQVEFPQTT